MKTRLTSLLVAAFALFGSFVLLTAGATGAVASQPAAQEKDLTPEELAAITPAAGGNGPAVHSIVSGACPDSVGKAGHGQAISISLDDDDPTAALAGQAAC